MGMLPLGLSSSAKAKRHINHFMRDASPRITDRPMEQKVLNRKYFPEHVIGKVHQEIGSIKDRHNSLFGGFSFAQLRQSFSKSVVCHFGIFSPFAQYRTVNSVSAHRAIYRRIAYHRPSGIPTKAIYVALNHFPHQWVVLRVEDIYAKDQDRQQPNWP